ncbi:MAG: nitrogenase component 1 [Clostridiales bacterium]|jgi:nitrogenase molybdenum-iron protein alpha chain|nr:nitrogenase component 1 [Clostridiales bacterium]
MALKDAKFALIRERRSEAISSYHGTLTSMRQDLGGESVSQRVRTFTQAVPDEIAAALTALSGVEDAAVIVHGVSGCSSGALGLGFGRRVYSTDLNERDTILGGDSRLRGAIERAAKDGAKAIFVLGTPVVAINNDDSSYAAFEAESELGIKVVFLNTDGFKSKTAFTGYDVVHHSLLKRFIDAGGGAARDFANVLSIDEKAADVSAVLEILRALGIAYNILPAFSNLHNLKSAGSARVSVALNPSKTEYLAIGLEESFGVPYIRTAAPIGASATERFVNELGSAFSVSDKAEEYIAKKRAAVDNIFETAPLAGKKAFLHATPSQLKGLAELIIDLGGEIAGFAVTEIDRENRASVFDVEGVDVNVPVIIADGQLFEIANVLEKIKPDLFLSQDGQASYSAASGAVPVSLGRIAFYGYAGMRAFSDFVAKQIKGSRPLAEIGFNERELYSASWLRKSANWFVKRELK